jgi:FKBP-type peptidyl-prolyl cis-trans isomerase
MSVRYLVALLACFALVRTGGAMQEKKEEEKVVTTKSGLKYVELEEGKGPEVKSGDTVSVHYTGWLTDPKKPFDSSKTRNQPFSVTVDQTRVIQGWHEGLKGMKAGGKRKLIIPADLAYGKPGRPPVIPPNAELTFEIELLKIGR